MSVRFYNNNDFKWAKFLELNTEVIKDELLLNLNNKFWLPEHPDYVKSDSNASWKTLTILFFGIKNRNLIKQFPNTYKLIQTIPNLVTAQFSLLKSNSTILPHKGYTSMLLRSHLPIIVPSDKERCAIKIEDEFKNWKEGELLIFDDSLEHSAWNNSSEDRVVLMFDFVKPGITYSASEICRYKLENNTDPYLEKIAPKQMWLSWFNDGYFPDSLNPEEIH